MSTPVVVVAKNGTPVTIALPGFGAPMKLATNGFGIPVVVVSSGGIPVQIEGYVP